jgi:hypothetical protein
VGLAVASWLDPSTGGKVRNVDEQQEQHVETALLAYWTARDEAARAQAARGRLDVGARQTVTSGGHLDRVAQLLARVCMASGAPADRVFYKMPKDDPNYRNRRSSGFTLPGYFRPTKAWDVVVHDHSDGFELVGEILDLIAI